MQKVKARTWSAMRRMRTPSGWSRLYSTPSAPATAATIGLKMSVSKTDGNALKAGGRPFQAHAGVDVLLGQGLELAGADPVELGEDQVPDLDFLGPGPVVEDLGARPADAVGAVRRCAGGPEVVVLAHARDPFDGDLDLVVPDVVSLVVVEVDRDREPVGGDLEHAPSRTPSPSGSPRA